VGVPKRATIGSRKGQTKQELLAAKRLTSRGLELPSAVVARIQLSSQLVNASRSWATAPRTAA
jgi:hypothetical protein